MDSEPTASAPLPSAPSFFILKVTEYYGIHFYFLYMNGYRHRRFHCPPYKRKDLKETLVPST